LEGDRPKTVFQFQVASSKEPQSSPVDFPSNVSLSERNKRKDLSNDRKLSSEQKVGYALHGQRSASSGKGTEIEAGFSEEPSLRETKRVSPAIRQKSLKYLSYSKKYPTCRTVPKNVIICSFSPLDSGCVLRSRFQRLRRKSQV
jgi:hypothetical protein